MTNERTQWTPSAATMDAYSQFDNIGVLEVETSEGGEVFHILADDYRLIFGGACNAGFIESGYMTIERDESRDEAVAELFDDLQTFYRDGAGYASRIVHNDRM